MKKLITIGMLSVACIITSCHHKTKETSLPTNETIPVKVMNIQQQESNGLQTAAPHDGGTERGLERPRRGV